MRFLKYLRTMLRSFYSRELYREVATRWDVGVVLYLLFVLTVCWIFMMLKIQLEINQSAKLFASEYASQFPLLTIKNGVISTPENHPYVIQDPNTKQVFATVDTSSQNKNLDLSTRTIIVTNNKIMWTSHDGVVKTYQLAKNINMTLDPIMLKDKLLSWAKWSWLLIFPMFLLVSFSYRLVEALIYAVIGKILGLVARVSLPYTTVFKLTIVAMTPVIVIGTLLDWFELNFPRIAVLYFVLALTYILFAVSSNRTKKY